MPAGQVGGVRRPSPASSGRSPANAPTTSASVTGGVQRGVEDVEQEADLGRARRRARRRPAVDRFVGEADVDQPVGLREREHEPVALAGHRHDQRGGRMPERRPRAAPGGCRGTAAAAPSGRAVRPHAGGVDHRPGPDLVPLAGRRCRAPTRRGRAGPRRGSGSGCGRRAPAAVRASATTRRASSTSCPSHCTIPPRSPARRTAGTSRTTSAVPSRRERGSAAAGVPAASRSASPAAKPARVSSAARRATRAG